MPEPTSNIEIHAEDQYATVAATVLLTELHKALPAQLHYRAPCIATTINDWVRSAGVGIANAPEVRHDVLGLTYRHDALGLDRHDVLGLDRHDDQSVRVGGVVVKNVSGYDVVRLLVGHDPSCSGNIALERCVLRLRPRPALVWREQNATQDQLEATLQELHVLGAVYALAYQYDNVWRVRGEWWNATPTWGENTLDAVPEGARLHDLRGPYPRATATLGPLETALLAAL